MRVGLKIFLILVFAVLFAVSFVDKKSGARHLDDINCIAILELAADIAYSKGELDKYHQYDRKKRAIYQSYPEGHLLSNQIVRSKVTHKARLKKSKDKYLNSKLLDCGFTGTF